MNPENFDQPTFAEILQGYEAEVARLTAELAAAREEISRRDAEFNEPGRWGVCGSDLGDGTTCQTIVQRWTAGDLERAAAKAAELYAAVFGDAARRAGGEG